MPQTIRTTGDRGLDRELDALRDALRRVSAVPSPASPGTIERSPFGPYVRSVSEQGNTGASGDITFTDSGGTEITQADQNFDFYSPPLCDDPPEDVAKITTEETQASDVFTGTNFDELRVGGGHPNLDTGGNWIRIIGADMPPFIYNNRVIAGVRGGTVEHKTPAIATLTSNEYTIKADWHVTSLANFGFLGFLARVKDDSGAFYTPRYELQYQFDGSTVEWFIYKVTAGPTYADVTDGGTTTYQLTEDATHSVEFRVTAARKSAWVNGVEVCWTDDDSITGTTSTDWNTGIYLHLKSGSTSTNPADWFWMDNYQVLVGVDSDPQGDSTYMSRCDHVHEGVHSIARRTASGTAGTALTGDVVLQEDGGIVLNETVASSRVKIAEGFWRDLLTMGI